ncbi:MAG: ABC transporter permease, partial [Alphaproteobacteria bacterium]|nr:ABC transporter permease [Alphaproteobacteria bacterium]
MVMRNVLSSLNQKLLRDVWRMRAQILAIAAVVAAGTAVFVMMNGVERSLEETRAAYYESHRFADLFAPVKRAPEHLVGRLRELSGVVAVETRITGHALIDMAGEAAPITASVVSVPNEHRPLINDLYLTGGRWVEPDFPDEAILSTDFLQYHDLEIGDRLNVTLNGIRRSLHIVGTALSPEFVYPIPPGEIVPDEQRFAVIWMARRALATAYDLDGAFNEVVLRSILATDGEALIGLLDRLLEPYGATGAYDRTEQTSNRFLDNELDQLRTLGRLVPFIFFVVSAFLLNVTIQRIVETDREQIGLLKAFGYQDGTIAWQYVKFALAVVAIGLLAGWAAGTMMGRGLASIYTEFFKFPSLLFRPGLGGYAFSAVMASVAAGAGGIFGARARP